MRQQINILSKEFYDYMYKECKEKKRTFDGCSEDWATKKFWQWEEDNHLPHLQTLFGTPEKVKAKIIAENIKYIKNLPKIIKKQYRNPIYRFEHIDKVVEEIFSYARNNPNRRYLFRCYNEDYPSSPVKYSGFTSIQECLDFLPGIYPQGITAQAFAINDGRKADLDDAVKSVEKRFK